MQEVRYETFDSPVSIYNFEVEDFHTYYVGENPVLVHNKCGDDSLKTFVPDEYWERKASKYGIPNTTIKHQRYNSYTGEIELSTVSYDYAGRQSIRIDWTNHGRSNHENPHVHYTTYGKGYAQGRTIRWD